MHIVSGYLKGRKIPTAKNAKYRPSTGRFKEALFSILTSSTFEGRLKDKKFLDLYSGSGAIGLEAISRGTKKTTFVDLDKANIETLKDFISEISIEDKAEYLCCDASRLGYTKEKYDIVFMDPPYHKDMAQKTLSSLIANSWMEDKCLVIIEIGATDTLIIPEKLTLHLDRKYGNSRLMILEYLEE